MKLQIKLLSDLCVSSGESFNAYVDTDVVYDECGLPYLPAKRLKGCIREAALELVEMGLADRQTYDTLFGREGFESTLFSMDNAYLQDYDRLVSDLKNCKDRSLVHAQRVLGLFTYLRTQTALKESGTADDGSLRTLRVVNKGLTFEANLRENGHLSKEQTNLLTNAIGLVKHIGSGRTRGLGLVTMTVPEETKDAKDTKETQDAKKQDRTFEIGDRNKISYTLTLQSPLLCKSATGSQEKTHDYIEGSKIIGVLASRLPQDVFSQLMGYDGQGKSIIASNAYISENGDRYVPARASLQKKKDQSYDPNGQLMVADMLLPNTEEVQWTPVGSIYINREGCVKTVETETNYHHRRPADKSIGKANGKDASAFYQLESIQRGQQFAGFLLADREQAEVILSAFQASEKVRMGYNRSAEYGDVTLAVTGVEILSQKTGNMVTEFVVQLNSPVILYNDNCMPAADITTLKQYLAERLAIPEEDCTINASFLTYETIGGFNVTWHRRKPIFTALGKGTVCRVTTKRPVDITLLENAFIGERVAEGYGEIQVYSVPEKQVLLQKAKESAKTQSGEQTDILRRLESARRREEFSYAGVQQANNMFTKQPSLFGRSEFKASLGKLLLLAKEQSTLEGIKEQIAGIETNTKRELCEKLIKSVELGVGKIWQCVLGQVQAANDGQRLKEFLAEEHELQHIYLLGFLYQIKYLTYHRKGDNTNE